MILVTGGAGYLGCVAVRALLARGQRVRVLDTCWFGTQGLADVLDKIELVRDDLRTVPHDVLRGCDAVLHAAGLSNDPTAAFNPTANTQINADATARLAGYCLHYGIRKFIFASTAAVYDRGLSFSDALQDEDSEIAPHAPYAASKAAAERALIERITDDFGPVILRQGTVHGWSPRMRFDLVVNTFVRDALTTGKIHVHAGGETWRPMIHVRDMAEAYVQCLLDIPYEQLHGRVLNVFHRNFRMLELAHQVREALRAIRDVDIVVDYTDAGRLQRSYRVSGERAARIGILPKTDVTTSVAEMVARFAGKPLREWYDPRSENMPWLLLLEELRKNVGLVR